MGGRAADVPNTNIMPSLKYAAEGRPLDVELLLDAAWSGFQNQRRRRQEHRRRLNRIRRGATLRPGPKTPLWNALVDAIRPLVRRPGAKAILAAELGLHRARMTDFFVNRSGMPDAERTLLLIEWYCRNRRP